MVTTFATPQPPSQEEIINADKDYFGPFWNNLIQIGYIDKDQFKQALIESPKSQRPLLNKIEELTQKKFSPGLIKQYKNYILFQLKIVYGVDYINLQTKKLDIQQMIDQMIDLIDNIFNINVCRRYKILPIKKLDQNPPVILIAMINPDNLAALDTIQQILRSKKLKLKIKRIIIIEEDYENLLKQFYKEKQERNDLKRANAIKEESQRLTDVTSVMKDVEDIGLMEAGELSDNAPNQSPIIKLVNKILVKALQVGASEIYIEPRESTLNVRIRKDGVLHQIFTLPKRIITVVVSRVKVMADLDIGVNNLARQGKFRRIYDGRIIDFLVNIIPSQYGESISLEIGDNTYLKSLDFLVAEKNTLNTLKKLSNLSQGLIIFTGTSKVGKSVTGYSFLAEINQQNINIYTLEKFVKFNLDYITQVESSEYQNTNFASILETILLNNPDIIYINKLEDAETAKIAFNAVSKGKLILAEIDENNINNVFLRLQEWDIKPARIATNLKAIICQRLLRRVCEKCRIFQDANSEILMNLGLDKSSLKNNFVTTYHANSLTPEALEKAQIEGKVCPKCGGVGYQKMIAIYEIMEIKNYLKNLILTDISFDILRQEAIKQGMTTLFDYSLNLVKQGITTLEEIQKVLSDLIELK